MKRRTIVALVVLAAAVVTAVASATTSVKPYVVAVGSEYEVDALFSVGDTVPMLGGSGTYRMVGIPDGLGAHANPNGTSTLFMNHELGFTALSEPYVGGTKNRGAFVSKWILDADGDPTAGKRAYDKVYVGDTLVGDAATTANSTPAFARFCSGSLAGTEHGFDRPIYFANEESSAQPTFDGKGGLAVAIFENNGVGEAHGLPGLGRFAWENTLVQPGTGNLHGDHGNGGRALDADPDERQQPAVHVRRRKGPEPGSVGAPAERPRRRDALRLPLEEQEPQQRVRVPKRDARGRVGRYPGRRRPDGSRARSCERRRGRDGLRPTRGWRVQPGEGRRVLLRHDR